MAAKVGSLIIDLAANVASLQRDFNLAQSKVQGFATKAGATLKTVGGAVAGAFAVHTIVNWAQETINAADQMGKMAAVTGASVENLSAFSFAARKAGTDVNEVRDALGNLAEKIVEASAGGQMGALFRSLGIEAKDSEGNLRATDAVLGDLADAFAQMPDGTAKSAVAMKLFGEQGVRLIPMLNEGRAGLERFKEEARAVGALITDETAAAAAQMNARLVELDAVLDGASNRIMSAILPSLEMMADRFLTASKESQGFKEVVETGFKIVASAGMILWRVLEDVGRGIGGVAAMAVSLFKGEFAEAGRISDQMAADSQAAWADTAKGLSSLWMDLGPAVQVAANQTAGAVTGTIKPALTQAKDAAKELEVELSKALGGGDPGQALADRMSASLDASKQAAREGMSLLLEQDALRAQLTETQVDDIEAAYAREFELLQQKVEDDAALTEWAAEQKKLLQLRKEQEITEAIRSEGEKRAQETQRSAERAASFFGGAFSNLLLMPLQEGFKGLSDILAGFRSIVLDLLKRIAANAFIFALMTLFNPAEAGTLTIGKLLGFADGGLIRGAGTGTSDSNIAAVSDGEFIVRAAAVDHFGAGFFDALNQMRIPAFAAGGLVGGGSSMPMGGQTFVQNVMQIRTLTPADSVSAVAETIGPATTQRVSFRQGGRDFEAQARAMGPKRSGA